MKLKEAKTKKEYQQAAGLFKMYAAQIGVDLEFQNFSQEIENLQAQYSRPTGVLFLVYDAQENPVGCFGVRALDSSVCELKRMYVVNEARGLGLGKQLLEKSITVAKELSYTKMRLDTLPSMLHAIGLYTKAGFYEIEPYRYNPIEGAKYFEIDFSQIPN
ncbi:GNAT family N-acetyltransferase [Flagellimonas algicola]|uniref:GNAT family N-acetyltransferase n=1 Tax=Flagellimonas algicola TaxID=2583815 RepID=A0ABY2WK51_9FLAO|nr:GNAT family N-acetyltransferase [Allomuricauda algicola]TMU54799.1 GNAT family N-acetyltransferase [Allomuricauda algicola]